MATTSMTYQGRIFTVQPTDNATEPYKLIGARGSVLSLVRTGSGGRLFWVRLANGKIQGGYVGQLSDGSLLHLPQSGRQAWAAQERWRADGELARTLADILGPRCPEGPMSEVA